MTIALKPCSSSRICAHGHDAATNTLALQFFKKGPDGPVAGPTYHYSNFPAEKYAELCAAESIGRFFGQVVNVKDEDGKLVHPFVKIEPEETPA